MSGAPQGRLPGGFSLVEAMAAMVLLSLVLMGLVPTLFHAMSQQRTDAVALERTAVLMGETNRLLSIPFAELDTQTGCSTVSAPAAFPHELCVVVNTVSGREREVVVVVTPGNEAVRADSVVLSRTMAGRGNPFNTLNQP